MRDDDSKIVNPMAGPKVIEPAAKTSFATNSKARFSATTANYRMPAGIDLNDASKDVVLDNSAESIETTRPISKPVEISYKKIATYAGVSVIAVMFLAAGSILWNSRGTNLNNSKQATDAISTQQPSANSLQSSLDSATIKLNRDTVSNKKFTARGQVAIQNEADSNAAFTIQDAKSDNLFVVDTVNKRVGVGEQPNGAAALQVAGDISTNGHIIAASGDISLSSEGLKIGSTLVCTAHGCISSSSPSPTPTSPTLDVANVAFINTGQIYTGANKFTNSDNSFSGDGSGLSNVNAATLGGNAAGFYTNAANINAGTLSDSRLSSNVAFKDGSQTFTGINTFKSAVNSLTAFQLQDSTGASNLLIGDTINDRIAIAKASASYTLDVGGSVNGTTVYQNGNQVCDSSGNCTFSSSNLSDSANIARLNANQSFTGNNTFTGTVLAKNATNSTTAFQVQDSNSNALLTVNTTAGSVQVKANTSNNANAFSVIDGFGGNNIFNVDTINQSGQVGIRTGANPGAALAVGSDSAGLDIFKVIDSTSTSSTVFKVADEGASTFQNRTNSTAAFQVQDNSGAALLNIDTVNKRLSVGNIGAPTGQLFVGGQKPVLVGQVGSVGMSNTPTNASAISGNYEYFASLSTDKLVVYDISNPANPVFVGQNADSNLTFPMQVAIQGHYAYVAEYNNPAHLVVYDISNPSTPTYVGRNTDNTIVYAHYLYVSGRYAYVGYLWSTPGIAIYDISNPAIPTKVGNISVSTPNGVYVSGQYLYAPVNGNTLQIYDVSNPAIPSLKGSVATTGGGAISVTGRYAYLAGNNKLQVFDISNPAAPADVSSGGVATSDGQSIVIQGRYAYVGGYSTGKLQVFDISNPAAPADVSSGGVATSGSTIEVMVSGRYAYAINANTSQLQVFDLGGMYSQQLEAGGAAIGTLQVNNNGQVAGDFNVQGNAAIGRSLRVDGTISTGGLNIQGPSLFQTPSDSTTAFQVQNSAGNVVVQTDTVNSRLAVGNVFESPTSTLEVEGPLQDAASGLAFNIKSFDTSAAAQNVGGGIGFGGLADTTRMFGAIQGYHESATAADYSGGLRFFTRQNGNSNLSQVLTLGSDGSADFKNSADSAAAFQVQNSAGTESLLTVDTTARSAAGGNVVKVGNSTGTDGNTTILVVDGASANPTNNLSALNGGIFYNSSTNKLSIIENGQVKVLCNQTDALCGGNSTTLQQSYDASASAPQITLNSSPGAKGVVIQDNATPVIGSLFTIQNNGGSTKYLDVSTSGVSVSSLSVSSQGFISLAGGATGSRPGSPTKGTLYFDTTTNQLLQYNGTKWTSNRSTTTRIVAASNSTQAEKDAADYIASGSNDESTINSALAALPATGGTVYLMEGIYTLGASISVPNNTTLSGAGGSTILTLPNAQNGSYAMVINSDTVTGTNIHIQNLLIDGNEANQTTGNMSGVTFSNVGGANRLGGSIENITAKNIYFACNSAGAIYIHNSNNNVVSGNRVTEKTGGDCMDGIKVDGTSAYNNISNNSISNLSDRGILINAATQNSITGNTLATNNINMDIEGNSNTVSGNTVNGSSGSAGIIVSTSYNTITGNNSQSNQDGIWLLNGSSNTISGNTLSSNSSYGIWLFGTASNNNISGNKIYDSGGATTNNGIYFQNTPHNNSISNNDITDPSCSTSCYAINVSATGMTGNYFSDNHFLGDGTHPASIYDATGSGNTYASQPLSESGDNSFRNSINSTTAFQIQNSSSASIFTVDTTNSQITLGAPSATPVLLVLGNKNTAGDPSCTSGAIYFNSNSNQFRGCINGGWTNLAGTNIGSTLPAANLYEGETFTLRAGSSPYDYIHFIYDGTYGKWVSANTWSADGDFGGYADTSYHTVASSQIIPYGSLYDAGVTNIQARLTGSINEDGVDSTDYKLIAIAGNYGSTTSVTSVAFATGTVNASGNNGVNSGYVAVPTPPIGTRYDYILVIAQAATSTTPGYGSGYLNVDVRAEK